MAEQVGWFSSFVLVITIAYQVWQQWRSGRSEGVSPWLFAGQIVASLGFLSYSILVENSVFIVTNCLLVLSAAVGLTLILAQRRKKRRRSQHRLGTLHQRLPRLSSTAPMRRAEHSWSGRHSALLS